MKRILITGASKGLGRYISDYYAQQGHSVIAVSRSGCKREGDHATRIRDITFDLTRRRDIVDFIFSVEKEPIDAVLHCMGGGLGLKSPHLSIEEIDQLMWTNFYASFLINDKIIERSRTEGRPLSIVHFDSVATSEVTASLGYTLAKSLIRPYVKHRGRALVNESIVICAIQFGALTGAGGAMDRLRSGNKIAYDRFMEARRPTGTPTQLDCVIPYIDLLLSDVGRLHAGNTIILDESELTRI